MVNANELRIGNLVKRIGVESKFSTVYSIGNSSVNFKIASSKDGKEVHTQGCYMEGVEPIQLTEGWLFMLGFTKQASKNETWYFVEDYISTNLDRIWIGNVEFLVKDMPVHRLQNIHYDLYMEELCLKP